MVQENDPEGVAFEYEVLDRKGAPNLYDVNLSVSHQLDHAHRRRQAAVSG
jgi:hypothetical protein